MLDILTLSEIGSDIITADVSSIGLDSLDNIGVTEPTFLAASDVDVAVTLAFILTRIPIIATYNSFVIQRKLS